MEIKPPVWGMALNPFLDSLIQVNTKKWDKRFDLFQRIEANTPIIISSDIMPTNGDNYHHPQLESIRKTFCIVEPLYHDIAFKGRLQEIVSNRINIAHGNLTPAEIGSKVTVGDLYTRLDEVSKFCSYFIAVFEDYINLKKFKVKYTTRS
jgi:hypothetical protein